MEKLLKTDTSLHAELLAEIQKELNVDLNKAKSSQKKEANDDVIKARNFSSCLHSLTKRLNFLIIYSWYYFVSK